MCRAFERLGCRFLTGFLCCKNTNFVSIESHLLMSSKSIFLLSNLHAGIVSKPSILLKHDNTNPTGYETMKKEDLIVLTNLELFTFKAWANRCSKWFQWYASALTIKWNFSFLLLPTTSVLYVCQNWRIFSISQAVSPSFVIVELRLWLESIMPELLQYQM